MHSLSLPPRKPSWTRDFWNYFPVSTPMAFFFTFSSSVDFKMRTPIVHVIVLFTPVCSFVTCSLHLTFRIFGRFFLWKSKTNEWKSIKTIDMALENVWHLLCFKVKKFSLLESHYISLSEKKQWRTKEYNFLTLASLIII